MYTRTQAARARKSAVEGNNTEPDCRANNGKKKSELRDLKEGYQVNFTYKQEVVNFVERQKSLGVSRSKVLTDLDVSSSTYYSWKKLIEQGPKEKTSPKPHPAKLTVHRPISTCDAAG